VRLTLGILSIVEAIASFMIFVSTGFVGMNSLKIMSL